MLPTKVKDQCVMTNYNQQNFPLGRINVKDEAYFSPDEGSAFLCQTVMENWPEDQTVDILVTPGGFVYEESDEEWGKENKVWNATPNDIKEFVKRGKKNVRDMLKSSKFFDVVQGKAKYISIGSDIRFADGFSAELVFLVSVKSREIIHWTGKSYPTKNWQFNQEPSLVQVTDLKTHFKKLLNHRVMILGCHDLHMFNNRSKNRGDSSNPSNRMKRRKKMIKFAKEFNPTMVIHHPHTTDSAKIWSTPWGSLKNEFQDVKFWASGISYYNYGDDLRGKFDNVLKSTRSPNKTVLEIELVEI